MIDRLHMNGVERLGRNESALLTAGIFFAAFFSLYYPVIVALVKDWGLNDNYSHGYFIPFIAGYLIFLRWEDLQKVKARPENWGLAVLVFGLVQAVLAKLAAEFFLQRTSMLIVLGGSALFLAGLEFTRKIWFPLVYLIFMVPVPAIIWNKLALPMQLLASTITEKIITTLDIPVFRTGNILYLSQTTLEVVDACSGLRSLVTMFALSAVLAYVAGLNLFKKWLLFLAAAPIAVIANIVRLTVTAALAHNFGAQAAQGFLHDASGWLVFVMGLLMLVAVNHILHLKTEKHANTRG